jgi:hypothetical protein
MQIAKPATVRPISSRGAVRESRAPRERGRFDANRPPLPAELLDLQRLAGNAAVSALLQERRSIRLQRETAWPDAPAPENGQTQGINAGPLSSGSFTRYPVHGISLGNTDKDRDDAAWEAADHRAIVLLPSGLEATAKPDVLVLFHGHSVGWREGRLGASGPVSKKKPKGSIDDPIGSEFDNGYAVKGDTRDRVPDNLAASLNPKMIAVLPQGTHRSDFGSYETKDYVRQALTLIDAKWKEGNFGRIVLSAHSGGGPAITSPLAKSDRKAGGVAISPEVRDIALFDAINGTGEEKNVRTWLSRQIAADIARLEVHPHDDAAQREYLATSTRFRAFFSDTDKSKKHPRGFYVDQHRRLQDFLADTFKDRPDAVTPGAWTELGDHYVIDGPQVGRSHDDMIKDNLRPALDELGLAMPKPAAVPVHKLDERVSIQLTQADDLEAGWKSGGKAAVCNLLRQWGMQGPINADKTLATWLDAHFGPSGASDKETDERWLVDQFVAHGSEPHWPAEAFKGRAERAKAHKWAAQPGNIEGTFDTGKGKAPVEAYFFPGSTDRRALIIGGVHGTEPSGVEVVNDLLADLRKPGPPPYFSVIVVPVMFPEQLKAGKRPILGTKDLDPNRNLPAVGKSLGEAKDKKGTYRDAEGRKMAPENVILVDLIERFQPERIASVHGHKEPVKGAKPGTDMPGIFADPRPGDAAKEDAALSLKMATAASAKGVRVPGNWVGTKDETSVYPPDAPKMTTGKSLGDYGPHETSARPAVNVITVEVFGDATSEKSKDGEARKKELESLASVLQDIFLGPPDKS